MRQIELTLTAAEHRVSSFEGRVVARKRLGRRTLEVVYKRLNDHALVITAYWREEGG